MLGGLQNDELPTLEPGTRSPISARFTAPGHETPRARRGDDPRAGGRRPRPSADVCAEPLRHEGSPETRGVLSSAAGPSQNGTCSGGGIGRKSRGSTMKYFRFGRTRVCMRESVYTGCNNGFFRERTAKQSYHVLLIASSCMHDMYVCCGFGSG